MKIAEFEDIISWQKSQYLAKLIYELFRNNKDYGFKDQIQRASVSVMSNIAEGFESGTRQEFLNYLYIAKGSAGEVRAQLYVALDAGYLNTETFKHLNNLAVECSKLTSNFTTGLKNSEFKGLQHKKEHRKGMSETNKMILENDPKLKEFYNPEKDEIEFWRR